VRKIQEEDIVAIQVKIKRKKVREEEGYETEKNKLWCDFNGIIFTKTGKVTPLPN
jgi:hypothetical protein